VIVNKKELGELLGVSPQAVDGWISRGAPRLAGGGGVKGSRFETSAVANWLIDRRVSVELTSAASEKKASLRRLLTAQAMLAELRLRREQAQLVTKEDVDKAWRSAVVKVREVFAGVPTGCAGAVHAAETADEARTLLEIAIHAAMERAGDEGVDLEKA
jgi:phage terminase Nu1 subunit (DNA packaging protein)